MSFLRDLSSLHNDKQKAIQEAEKQLVSNIHLMMEETDNYEESLYEAAENIIGAIFAMIKNDKDPSAKMGTSHTQKDKSSYYDQLGMFLAAMQATIDVGEKQSDEKQNVLASTLDDANFKPDDSAFKKLLVVGDKYKAGKAYFTWSQKFDDYARALAVKSTEPQAFEKIKSDLSKEIQLLMSKFQQVSAKLQRAGSSNQQVAVN